MDASDLIKSFGLVFEDHPSCLDMSWPSLKKKKAGLAVNFIFVHIGLLYAIERGWFGNILLHLSVSPVEKAAG